ncbi:MAG: filamentous hemagglutinin N-terminal domain-containing protein [Leptolyngbya sp. SIO4C1]|nr:filamentous hemagglutinin N-terminal domain-containing protein [Leptolyngbya sp. SIO4C1]
MTQTIGPSRAIKHSGWQLSVAGCLACGILAAAASRGLAQSNIVPDSTLATESSAVLPSFDGLPIEVILGGAERGRNLFHSFEAFNVAENRGAYFFSPDGIETILSRVTGGRRSDILGTLGVLGEADLFLINPNGIVFGPDASLDVEGSFVATTADALQFNEQAGFSAAAPETSRLLSIQPAAFFFTAESQAAEIVNQSTALATVFGLPTFGLQVPDGESLLLVGGDIDLAGGVLLTFGGQVELGGVRNEGTILLTRDGDRLGLAVPDAALRSDVALTDEALILRHRPAWLG